jgi:capsid protein
MPVLNRIREIFRPAQNGHAALEQEVATLKEQLELIGGLPFVDPWEALRDPETGELWIPVSRGNAGQKNQPALDRAGFRDEMELEQARNLCRVLAERNEFAINGHENRISYIVGTGHTYQAVSKKGQDAPKPLIAAIQKLIDDWTFRENWMDRQQEIVRRKDRDGEAFLRFFDYDGLPCVRFVEPWQIKNPGGPNAATKFGIETEPNDAENILIYYVDGEPVDVDEIQHRKANVDRNVRRGMPLFWPVLKLLEEVGRVMVYSAALAKVRAAFAVVRTITGAGSTGASTFTNAKIASTLTNSTTGEKRNFEPIRPGQIRTNNENVKHEMPASNIGAADYDTIVQMHLRAVASRLVMPEFMLTSNAANSNYASTLVAEGPAVKAFERWQATQKNEDLYVIWRVIRAGIASGMIPEEAEQLIEINVGMPIVQSRDPLRCRSSSILVCS